MEFTRVDGAGNTFLLADLRGARSMEADLGQLRAAAPPLCAQAKVDGLLAVCPPDGEGDAAMVVFNRDGSRPEMCGNGLRCVAAYVARNGGGRKLVLATDAGARACEVTELGKRDATVRIDMGPARVLGETHAGGGRRFVDVSTGNPHAVCFVEADDDPDALALEIGPDVERDDAYAPERTNVEFVRIEPDGSLRVAVWERGVGITRACGTGACAAAAAAVREGLAEAETELHVQLPGGVLAIRVPTDETGGVVMTGPARES